LLGCDDCWGSRHDDGVDLEPDEFGGNLSEALAASLRPAILDCDGAAVDPPEFAQPLHKRDVPLALSCRRARSKESDCRQVVRLLRARRERPCHRRATQRGDEFSPSDVGCHATLPWGSCPCNGGNDTTLFALRKP